MSKQGIDDTIRIAAVFRTLSDPFRLRMFTVLRDRCLEQGGLEAPIEFSDAIETSAVALNMSPSLAEQHLLELARADIIIVRNDAQGRPLMCLNAALVREVSAIVQGTSQRATDGQP